MAAGPSPAAARAPALKLKARAGPGTDALQRRMKVGAAGDRFEREADRIADHVVGSSALPAAAPPPVISPLSVQREALDEERETGPEKPAAQLKAGPEKPAQEDGLSKALKDETAQRAVRPATSAKPSDDEMDNTAKSGGSGTNTAQRAMRAAGPEATKVEDELSKALNAQRDAKGPGAKGGTAPSGVESSIQAMRSGPAPGLAAPLRSRMENKMGVDLGGARVHSGALAGKAADALNARAFTVGQDMFFGRGQYDPVSTSGQRLIAHETAHTVQQRGGSAGVQRIRRATAKDKSATEPDETTTTDETKTQDEILVANGSIDLKPAGKYPGTVKLPALELPIVDGVPKGVAGTNQAPAADDGWTVPVAGQKFRLNPHGPRPSKKAMDVWVEYGKTGFAAAAKSNLKTQIAAQGNAAPLSEANQDVFVIYSGKNSAKAEHIIIGTIEELSMHDSVLRPQFSQKGTKNEMDADHILEWQLGGTYAAKNMQMLKSNFNRNAGPRIDGRIKSEATRVIKAAKKYLEDNPTVETPRKLPADYNEVKANWVLEFNEVKGNRKLGTTSVYWPRAMIEAGDQVQHFKAMTAEELVEQGFVFDPKKGPKFINVFPSPSGGRIARFTVDETKTKLERPGFFYKGIEILEEPAFTAPTAGNVGNIISTLKIKYSQRKKKGSKDIVSEIMTIDLKHDPKLGFGAYVTRDSIREAFKKDISTPKMSPIEFPDAQISPDGVLVAEGSILSSKALLPQLNIPIQLRGTEVFVDFPIPTEKMSFGPVSVTEASLSLGFGENGLFMSGQADIAIEKLGRGTLSAKTTKNDTVIGGKFAFDFNFVENAEVDAEYSLAKDDFKAKGTLTVKKDSLPGVERGTIEINTTRQSFGVTGTLQLGGVLAGSTITVGYTPETGLLIEGKDIPLPVDRLPGVSDAKVTVRAQRSPDTGEWLLSGAGSATLKAPGAGGALTIAVKGEQVHFDGRIDLAKGPAKGFILVTATNLQMDENGKPIESGPVGPLQIWGKGQASIAFGKVLTGTAGIEYTREGKIIITGEIALPPTVDLFKRVDYSKRLLEIAPPDFPIWGVKLGPVGIGIFAFVDARLDFLAYVGPGQLRDTKVNATMDLDKPSEATVEGKAQFYVPAFAGFRLDLGGGLKAQVAVAYVKGRVGLDGTLGLGVEGKLDVGVKWNPTDGLAFNANANVNVKASPKLELGVSASVTAGVDLPWPLSDIDRTWGPWRKKLGEFGPNMELSADFPVAWSEKKGLDFDVDKIKITKPKLDAKSLMKSAFDTLV